jgi:hypothetical protein
MDPLNLNQKPIIYEVAINTTVIRVKSGSFCRINHRVDANPDGSPA